MGNFAVLGHYVGYTIYFSLIFILFGGAGEREGGREGTNEIGF